MTPSLTWLGDSYLRPSRPRPAQSRSSGLRLHVRVVGTRGRVGPVAFMDGQRADSLRLGVQQGPVSPAACLVLGHVYCPSSREAPLLVNKEMTVFLWRATVPVAATQTTPTLGCKTVILFFCSDFLGQESRPVWWGRSHWESLTPVPRTSAMEHPPGSFTARRCGWGRAPRVSPAGWPRSARMAHVASASSGHLQSERPERKGPFRPRLGRHTSFYRAQHLTVVSLILSEGHGVEDSKCVF